jgi:hypothetical protein
MKRLIILLALLVLISLGLSLPRTHAEQFNFTGPNGNYAGSQFRHGNESAFQNSTGQFSGSSITHGPTTNFYDRSGRYTGSVTQQGTASNPLGNVNGSSPFGRGGR